MTPAETEWQIQRMVHRTKEAVDQTLRVITVLLPEVDAWRSTAGGGEKEVFTKDIRYMPPAW